MKVLVTCFSQSGNTEKIADAIWEEASQANQAEMCRTGSGRIWSSR
jgi:flavodoxin I